MKLKVFSFDAARLGSTMTNAVPQIIIPDAVLCSEMGVHFSPCGRYLVACIACHVRSATISDSGRPVDICAISPPVAPAGCGVPYVESYVMLVPNLLLQHGAR